ncbi:MAG TPA: ABC transporter permease [Clostridiales bacterium]|nr:ABC transporter permease [Clostridiales bacterium]
MAQYVLKRILMIIPVVFLVAITIFTIMYFCPGDPAEIILGVGAAAEDIEALREQMGLNDPFLVQLGNYLYRTFIKFDFGTSYANSVPIIDELSHRFSKTFVLAISAIIIEVIVGIPLGMVSATHRGGWIDQLCMILALIGISVPSFWIGLQLLLIFSLKLSWLPPYGVTTWQGWILPIFVNSLRGIAQMARQARSSMLEVIRSDYVTTARAKGLPERTILFRYALPNALIPLVQTAGQSFGTSLGGTVIIENVFSIPGVGQYMVNAIVTRDYAVIRSAVVVLAIVFSLVMLLVDIAFGFIDPRIKAQYEGRNRKYKWRKKLRRVAANA